MKSLPLLIAFTLAGSLSARASLYTINAGADAFVRAAAPDSNYGRAGMLNVSGPTALNAGGTSSGSFDTFLRFATAATRTQIDADFGAGLWRITAVSLNLTEVTSPGNALFNAGAGQFQVQWIGSDGWDEGTGNPNMPTSTGITWNTRGSFLNAAADRSLGAFVNPQSGGLLTSGLALDSSFITDLMTDAQCSLYLTAVAGETGFNFRSHDFVGSPTAMPVLELTVEAIPEPSSAALGAFMLLGLARRRRMPC